MIFHVNNSDFDIIKITQKLKKKSHFWTKNRVLSHCVPKGKISTIGKKKQKDKPAWKEGEKSAEFVRKNCLTNSADFP